MIGAMLRISLLHCFAVTAIACAGLVACAGGPPQAPSTAAVSTSDEYLRCLVGEWDITRSIRGKVVGNHMVVAPVLDGNFVQLHMTSTTLSDPYEAIVLVGARSDTREYVAYWCDSFGPEYSAVGRGVRVGDRLELRFEYPDGPFFNTWVHDPGADSWTFTGENSAADGSRRLFARDVVTRRR